MSNFGDYLKELRGNRSLREMEKITGLSHTYLSSLEKGYDPRSKKERKPTPETLKKLADTLNVSYFELMEKADYWKTADVNELFEKRRQKETNLRMDKQLFENHYLSYLSLSKEIKSLKELYSQQKPLNDEETKKMKTKLKKLLAEEMNLDEVMKSYIDKMNILTLEINELDNILESAIEYESGKEIREVLEDFYGDTRKQKISLENLFTSNDDIYLNSKLLSKQDKEKALQILKLAFESREDNSIKEQE